MEVLEDAKSWRFNSKNLKPVMAGQYDLSIINIVSPLLEQKLPNGCI